MRDWEPRHSLAAVLVSVAAATAGCGDGDGERRAVDADQIEQQIERDLSSATTEVTSVSCPDDVKSETGARFTCRAKLGGGGSAKVEVTETKAPDDFSYRFKPGSVKLSGAAVDTALEEDLAAGGFPGATVNCPDTVAVKPDTTVSCPVSGAGGGVATVTFTFSDASGTIDESSVDAAAGG